MKTVGPVQFCLRVGRETLDDSVFTWAAALAYSWMFAIFPFLIFLLALLPYVPDQYKKPVQDQLNEQITYVAPSEAGNALRSTLNELLNPNRATGGLLSIGILVALYAASGGMNATMAAMDRCYDVEIGRKFIVQRFVAAVLTVTVATLILLVLSLVPITTQIVSSDTVRQYLNLEGVWGYVFNFSRYFIALMLCLTILSLIYHFGPSVRSHWSWISPGSIFVVLVWAVLAFAFRYYIDNFGAASYAKTYGVVGSIALLLLVLYVDAIVLLIGAEINSEIDFAVLGLTSSANRAHITPPREGLSDREKLMLLELQRRRPGATAMAAMAARGEAVATADDPAASGPIYPMGNSLKRDRPTDDPPNDPPKANA